MLGGKRIKGAVDMTWNPGQEDGIYRISSEVGALVLMSSFGFSSRGALVKSPLPLPPKHTDSCTLGQSLQGGSRPCSQVSWYYAILTTSLLI